MSEGPIISIDKKSAFGMYLNLYGYKPVSMFYISSEDELEPLRETADYFGLTELRCCNEFSEDHDHWVMYGRLNVLRIANSLTSFKGFSPDYVFGLLCGIPNCCIEEYRGYEEALDMYKNYKDQLGEKEDPYNLREDDSKIIRDILFHIPCSPTCNGSKRLYGLYLDEMEYFEDEFWNGAD